MTQTKSKSKSKSVEKNAKNVNEHFNFEEELEKLEGLVQELESGKLSLDASLNKFELGLKLYKNCKSLLNDAEKKITVLSENLKEDDYIVE